MDSISSYNKSKNIGQNREGPIASSSGLSTEKQKKKKPKPQKPKTNKGLEDLEQEVREEVYSLRRLTNAELLEEGTNRLVRPCYSLVWSGRLTEEEWLRHNWFAQYYIQRVYENPNDIGFYECTCDKKLRPDFNDDEYEIYDIIADIQFTRNNKEYRFFLVQFFVSLEDESDYFRFRKYGEICIVDIDQIDTESEYYGDYIKSGARKSYLGRKLSKASFGSRETKGVPICKSVILDRVFGKNTELLNYLIHSDDYELEQE